MKSSNKDSAILDENMILIASEISNFFSLTSHQPLVIISMPW
jgi:hypothetical protein